MSHPHSNAPQTETQSAEETACGYTAARLGLRERLLDRVALRVRVGDAVRLRVPLAVRKGLEVTAYGFFVGDLEGSLQR